MKLLNIFNIKNRNIVVESQLKLMMKLIFSISISVREILTFLIFNDIMFPILKIEINIKL
jgi:hypothetical protein